MSTGTLSGLARLTARNHRHPGTDRHESVNQHPKRLIGEIGDLFFFLVDSYFVLRFIFVEFSFVHFG